MRGFPLPFLACLMLACGCKKTAPGLVILPAYRPLTASGWYYAEDLDTNCVISPDTVPAGHWPPVPIKAHTQPIIPDSFVRHT